MRKCAWIIEWESISIDHYPVPNTAPLILPWNWQAEQIIRFMTVLYWNSDFFTPFQALEKPFNSESQKALTDRKRSEYLRYGSKQFLIAVRVKDLKIERFETGYFMKWTRPETFSYNEKTGNWDLVTKPCPRSFTFAD